MDAFPAAAFDRRLEEVLYCGNPEVDLILRYLTENRGKLLRPRMLCLCGSISPPYCGAGDALMDIAVAVELIHMASLVHDDIIDNSLLRRGQPSLNQRWGSQISVLTGDFLFASAFNLISRCDQAEVMNILTATIKTMCSGEIVQQGMLFDLNINDSEYYDKIYRKTACLFAASCKVGAIMGRAPVSEIKILEQFGLALGYAYQMIDDVLDFVSDANLLGKPAAHDLSQGNITLPVILALQDREHGGKLEDILKNGFSEPTALEEVKAILETSGALETCVNLSRHHLDAGLKCLSQLRPHPVIEELEYLSRYLLDGYYRQLNTSATPDSEIIAQEYPARAQPFINEISPAPVPGSVLNP